VLCVGTFVANLSIWLFTNLPYVLIDHFRVLRRYKIQPNVCVDRKTLWAEFLRSTLTQCLTLPLCLYAGPLFRWTEFSVGALPDASAFVSQFVFFNVFEDFLFFWVHRLLHANAWLYRTVHSVHHRQKAPYSVAGAQAHPFELVFGFVMPTIAPPLLGGALIWSSHSYGLRWGESPTRRVHALAWWWWLLYRELRATESHSGYLFPWHLSRLLRCVGYAGARAHDKHHSLIRWNYGSFVWWDVLLGTALPEHMYADEPPHADPDAAAAKLAAEPQPHAADTRKTQ
jgi:4-alpha-methyl-delta7-sterol-4alpha-methyl oxidase